MSDIINVKVKRGAFYLTSPKDLGKGWELTKYKNPQTGADVYHKEVKVEGEFLYAGIHDGHKDKTLNIIIKKDSSTTYGITLPIYTDNPPKSLKTKKLDDFFKSVVGSLSTLKKGDYIKMSVNKTKRDKDGYLRKIIYISDQDDNLIQSPFRFKGKNTEEEPGVIYAPAWESEKTVNDFGEEVITWDSSLENKFFIKYATKIDEYFKTLKTEKVSQEQGPTPAPEEAEKEVAPVDDFNEDDLPF